MDIPHLTIMTKSKVLILGFGGVGVISGYTLEKNKKAEVVAIVRSDYHEIVEKGYKLESVDYGEVDCFKPDRVVRNVQEALSYGPFNFILVTTKNIPDIFRIEDVIEPAVTPKFTSIVLSQNGIKIEEPLIKKFPENVILSAVSMISSNKYGRVVKQISRDVVRIGFFNNLALNENRQKAEAEKFIGLYSNETNDCIYDTKVNVSRWRKLVYNATLNPICTLTAVDSGRLDIFGGYEGIIKRAMKEVVSIAKSDEVNLPNDIIDIMLRADDGIWCTPSMLVDFRKGNFLELEVIVGNAIRIANRNGIEAPFLTMSYELLKVIQKRTKEAKGLIKLPNERPEKTHRY